MLVTKAPVNEQYRPGSGFGICDVRPKARGRKYTIIAERSTRKSM